MKQEDIIRMARGAGAVFPADGSYHTFENVEDLERFAQLVAAHTMANIDPSKFMSYQEGYEAGFAARQYDIETLHALYQQACQQRDMLMDQQRAQIAAMRGKLQ